MRILILLVALLALVAFLLVALPAWPWIRKERREADEEPYDPPHQLDPSHPPPAIPEPEDDVGPGDRDVPPGSRRDRQRHGKP